MVLSNQQRMFPYLAQGVVDLLVPAPAPDTFSIPDPDPAFSARARKLAEGLARGELPADAFTAEAQAEFVPMAREYAPMLLGSLEPLREFTPVEDSPVGEGRRRKYRATYGTKVVVWAFEIAADDKLVSMFPDPR